MRADRIGFRVATVAAAALAIAGCGGSDGDATGQVSFSVTDAPVDEASAVVIAMTEFELKPSGGPSFRIPVVEEGRALNLLDFSNGVSALIIDEEEVPAGQFEWLRIYFDEEASYIQLEADGALYPLHMPSGGQTGYKLVSGFTVPANGAVEYILHFDLRKSVVAPPGQTSPFGDQVYFLKPAVRIMDVEATGGVEGQVADALLDLNNDEATCKGGNAVYAFEGHDVAPLAGPPLASDIVELNEATGVHEYHLMYLLPRDYTLAFTCSATADDGEVETYPNEDLGFSEAINVTVVAGQVKVCDIPPGAGQSDPC
jgi:hypothetical protein